MATREGGIHPTAGDERCFSFSCEGLAFQHTEILGPLKEEESKARVSAAESS